MLELGAKNRGVQILTTERRKKEELTHSSTGEEGGPSAHDVEITL